MVTMQEVDDQLKRLGVRYTFFGHAESLELRNILVPGEQIMTCMNGFYDGGIGLLVATDMRLILIDKKPFKLVYEDIRYDMITEIDFNSRLIDATTRIHLMGKKIQFRSWHIPNLRKLTSMVQERRMASLHQAKINSEQHTNFANTHPKLLQRPSMPAYWRRLPSKF